MQEHAVHPFVYRCLAPCMLVSAVNSHHMLNPSPFIHFIAVSNILHGWQGQHGEQTWH